MRFLSFEFCELLTQNHLFEEYPLQKSPFLLCSILLIEICFHRPENVSKQFLEHINVKQPSFSGPLVEFSSASASADDSLSFCDWMNSVILLVIVS